MNIKMHFCITEIFQWGCCQFVLNISRVLLKYRQTSYFPIHGMSSQRMTSIGPSSPWSSLAAYWYNFGHISDLSVVDSCNLLHFVINVFISVHKLSSPSGG